MSEPEPMDTKAAIDALNRALRLQYRSALQYLVASGGSTGVHAFAVAEELWRFAEAEFTDARRLVSKIVALGGEPDVEIEPLERSKDFEGALRALIENESAALEALAEVIPHTGHGPRSEALEHLVEHSILRKQDQVDVLTRALGR